MAKRGKGRGGAKASAAAKKGWITRRRGGGSAKYKKYLGDKLKATGRKRAHRIIPSRGKLGKFHPTGRGIAARTTTKRKAASFLNIKKAQSYNRRQTKMLNYKAELPGWAD